MLKRDKILLLFAGFLLFVVIFSFLADNSNLEYPNYKKNSKLENSSSLEGIENVLITQVNRQVNISLTGLISINDSLEIKNFNNNPISSFFYGIPVDLSDDLVFFKAMGTDQNTLLTESPYMIMNGHELIVIYFNSPLLPHQTRRIRIYYIYKDIPSYGKSNPQPVSSLVTVYPLLPYRLEGKIIAIFHYPISASGGQSDWGVVDDGRHLVRFNFNTIKNEIGADFIAPFLENLGDKKNSKISFTDSSATKTEMIEINRNIFISPWGIIRVKEDFSIQNLGKIDFYRVSFKIPKNADNLYISDDLGEILGITIENSGTSKYKTVRINLFVNRLNMTPNSIWNFKVEYNLPFENYVSQNWFQESVKIDLLTTVYDYLGRDQTINVIIDGCQNINSITNPPDTIKISQGTTIIVYKSDFVTPIEEMLIQFTFTIDPFYILLRPVIFILIIAISASIFVLITKTRKKQYDKAMIIREFIPVNEIREFSSLYEEKNALTLEIRQAEEDTKRKKMAKKKYKNILDKNKSKIEEIQQEIIPFKKIIIETNETFENIIKKLDVLEAERISVKDSLSLLESRYKRGRVPSRAAYQNLSDKIKKRRKKIDRTIDKLLQQLRSYTL
ncbi:MAG: hypothetical protein ACFFBV_03610 [Promethearchaeota archaeon]